MSYDYDLFVIGAGSGGLAASKRAASYGAKVAIAERDLVGGTCVIRGCVPKKLMVYASKFAHYYEDAVGYGWSEVQPSFDWQKLVTRVDNEVKRLSKLHISLLEKAGVELIPGDASLLDPHTIKVGDRKVTADKILIAVGGEAIKPDIPGAKEYTITSREIFLLPEQPKRFAAIGAGYIAVEFSCIMNALGSEVTQFIRGDRFLRGFDEEIRSNVQDAMIQHGINVVPNSYVPKIEKVSDGLEVTYLDKEKNTESKIIVDAVLFAIGRAPNLAFLGLENTNVEIVQCEDNQSLPNLHGYTTNCAIKVDEYSRTTEANIFAVGDCTNRINLTPVAINEGRAFADTEFGDNPRVFSHETVASAVFSQPEAATVGLNESEAKEKYGDAIKIYRARFRPMYHSFTGKDEKVLVKLVVDSNTDKVLGAHIVGENAAEIIQGVAIALKMGATKKDFDATVGIHPSTAEEFVTLR
ncbi:glutathione-disulfide reductase [Aerosakkonemataceae cyanobacterium BLCC-F154]|uniref:Glutathione reductase n=1 Tax=Floridaenema fluviatile BLCC-F154 TaxID=3153640 RepID=A0ABV4Y821_9CYAN